MARAIGTSTGTSPFPTICPASFIPTADMSTHPECSCVLGPELGGTQMAEDELGSTKEMRALSVLHICAIAVTQKMRRIDIFVSSPEDVQAERILVERSIRSIAAEFSVPITVTYSNWLRRPSAEDKVAAQRGNGCEEGRSWLYPCFWEYQDFELDQDYRERIPNTGSYDLVISILWSRLGTNISPAFVMPDGSRPQTANEYEIAWVLDQLTRTPGFPELRVYRNRSTPTAPLRPKEHREIFFRQWDAVRAKTSLAWMASPFW